MMCVDMMYVDMMCVVYDVCGGYDMCGYDVCEYDVCGVKICVALWLNLSDSRNILIIHFGPLLKERTLDSIGHGLWKKYNVICLLWMIRYISLLTNIFTQWILIDA